MMDQILKLVVFLFSLSVMVIVHEFGHLVVARLSGIKVYEFSVGFGPQFWGFKWKGIKYSFRWIILGGFVKLAGMDQAVEGEAVETAEDDPGSILNRPLWAKIATIAAGPICNLLLAVFMFVIIFRFMGLAEVTEKPIIGMIMPQSPAYMAGLREGDKIIAVDEKKVKTWMDFSEYVHKTGHVINLAVERDRKTYNLKIKPEYDKQLKTYKIGVSPQIEKLHKLSWKQAVSRGMQTPYLMVSALVDAIKKRVGLAPMGLVGMAEMATSSQSPWWFYNFLNYMAIAGLSLALFNLLPLPILDGGWIALFIVEAIRHKPLSENVKNNTLTISLFLIILLFLILTYREILGIVIRNLHMK